MTISMGDQTNTYDNDLVIAMIEDVDQWWINPEKSKKSDLICLICEMWTLE